MLLVAVVCGLVGFVCCFSVLVCDLFSCVFGIVLIVLL